MPASPTLRRRRLLTSVPLLTLAALPARAEPADLALTCDTTLGPALRMAAAAFKARAGVHVFIFPTSPGLILPQLQREIQNDIVVTQTTTIDAAVQAGVVAATVPVQWRNPVVLAGLQGAAVSGTLAAVDPSPASDFPAASVLDRLELKPSRVIGAIDTDEVAFLLATGAAQTGLLHMTDVRANDGIVMIRPVPAPIQPPLAYAASVTKLSGRPNPQAFVSFLGSAEARDILNKAGLETVT